MFTLCSILFLKIANYYIDFDDEYKIENDFKIEDCPRTIDVNTCKPVKNHVCNPRNIFDLY